MKSYVHQPTMVEAVQVTRPFKRVGMAVPFAHMVLKASGAFAYFSVSRPGQLDPQAAHEGDWIVRYPDGGLHVFKDNIFRELYDAISQ